eukprot:CAMPEP_0114974794 /NCGR_PEP_ID=MMETSP0216-20121206/1726_1 /TAXON_ID=223996 /ORGANISM="Protocruzia adherens, Strain Boccale" /LENGTH=643 /DNA_ID=CAMNT_0002335473 /DNA_START=32 /DNA_END=1963 /DNA_ORIENTATION=+
MASHQEHRFSYLPGWQQFMLAQMTRDETLLKNGYAFKTITYQLYSLIVSQGVKNLYQVFKRYDHYDLIDKATGMTDTMLALLSEDSSFITYVMEGSNNLKNYNKNGDSAMHIACMLGVSSAVDYLIDQGFSVDEPQKMGLYPIHIAAKNGAVGVLNTLISNNVSTDVTTRNEQFNFLEVALRNKQHTFVENVLTLPEIDVKPLLHQELMWIASFSASPLIVSKLSQLGLELWEKNSEGRNSLHLAILGKQLEVVAELCKTVPDSAEVDKFGDGFLHLACRSSNLDIIREVLKIDSDFWRRNNQGVSPIENFIIHVKDEQCYQELRKQVDIKIISESRNSDNMNIFFSVLSRGPKSLNGLFRLLADEDFDFLSDKTDSGENALHIAARVGASHIASDLLDRGISPREQDEAGRLPLHFACRNGHLDVVKVLLNACKAQSLLNTQNYRGYTPLHVAIISNKPAIAQRLLDIGSDASIRCNRGFDSIMLACAKGFTAFITKAILWGFKICPNEKLKLYPIDLAASGCATNVIDMLSTPLPEEGACLDIVERPLTSLHCWILYRSSHDILDDKAETLRLLSQLQKWDRATKRNARGHSPSQFASRHGDSELLECLDEKNSLAIEGIPVTPVTGNLSSLTLNRMYVDY